MNTPPLSSRTGPALMQATPRKKNKQHPVSRRWSFPYTTRESAARSPLVIHNQKLPQIYEVDDFVEIGKGAFGSVYPARQIGHGPWNLAAKVIPMVKKGARDAWKNEQRIFKLIPPTGHPHVVNCINTGVRMVQNSREIIYMIFERLSTTTLDKYVERNFMLEEEFALDIFAQLAEAVRYLHSLGISPRDIKGENIAFDLRSRCVKLFDFGLAVYVPRNASSIIDNVWTGTPLYMAPEVLHGRPHDTFLADMWSLGQVLFHMIAGKCMYQGAEDMQELVCWADPDEPVSIDWFPDTIFASRVLPVVFNRLVNSHPHMRWTAVELVEYLNSGRIIITTPVRSIHTA